MSGKGRGKTEEGHARGDRSKRLLDLVMILLGTRTPVTYREIREQFPAYQTVNAEAGLRAFERDKADLLELGVPIRYVTPDEDDSLEDGGYVIDLKRFKMLLKFLLKNLLFSERTQEPTSTLENYLANHIWKVQLELQCSSFNCTKLYEI